MKTEVFEKGVLVTSLVTSRSYGLPLDDLLNHSQDVDTARFCEAAKSIAGCDGAFLLIREMRSCATTLGGNAGDFFNGFFENGRFNVDRANLNNRLLADDVKETLSDLLS